VAEGPEDVLREFERRRPIATQLAVSLTHLFPGRDRQVSELLSSFLALRFSDEPPVDPVFVLMHAFRCLQSTTKAKPLALALALVNAPDTWNLLSPHAILEWAQFWARRSWPRAKEWVSEPAEPALFHRHVRGAPFEIEDATAYADLVIACLSALAKNLGPKTDDIAAAEATFLASNSLVEASARLRAFRRDKKGPPRPPGRPRTVLTTTDTRILKAWQTGAFQTYSDLARELDTPSDPVDEIRVRKVIERARMAKRRRRTKPSSSP
jgi:hypothetical protein